MIATASAPGKIILFGEHAVVHGRPAIAVPVMEVQARVTVSDGHDPHPGGRLVAHQTGEDAPLQRLGPDHWASVLEMRVRRALRLSTVPPFCMEVDSDIPLASGMGSGAAVAVAGIRALLGFLQQELPEERINQIAFQVEKVHHGTPSGIDNSVVTFAKPVFFIRDRPIEILRVARPFTVVIADTGIPSPTRKTVADVRQGAEQEPDLFYRLFDEIGSLTRLARKAIISGQPMQLGPLMTANQQHLAALGVSSPELDELIFRAMRSGALGAKLSGGGRGGNLIVFPPPDEAEKTADVLKNAGAVSTIITRMA